MFKKRLFTLFLTIIFVLGIAAAASADPGKAKGKTNWKFKNTGKWKAVQLVDIGSHWAVQPIQFTSSYGIIQGYADCSFRPNNNVTKYEAIMMISRVTGFTGTFDGDRDDDYDAPAWMQDCLEYAVSEGILTADEARDLNGNAPAKRYEVAVWTMRAIGFELDDQLSFKDRNEIPYYAKAYVGGMCKYGYMIGYTGNIFQPNKPVTRAEMATVLYRIIIANMYNDTHGDEDKEEDNKNGELAVKSLKPADGSNNVDAATDVLTARFNMDIVAVADMDSVRDGISVTNITDDEAVAIDDVSIEGKTLTIELDESLASGKTYRVTIEADIIEAEDTGENFDGISGSKWEFSTGSATFGIVRLTPKNGADDVDGDTVLLKAKFNGDIRVISGKSLIDAVQVYNRSDDEDVDVRKVEINGDTLKITLDDPLEEGDTFEVTLLADYLEAKDTGRNFKGLDGEDWSFTTDVAD